MPYPRALTEAEELDAVQRYRTGWTCQQLADRFECSRTAIRRALERQQVTARPSGQQPKAGPDATRRIVELRDRGTPWFTICDEVGLSYNAVRKRYLKAKGLPLVAYKAEGEAPTGTGAKA